MLPTVNDQSDTLAIILPEPVVIKIPRKGGDIEELEIMPLPFRKWRIAFRYIAQIAPLFGFDLEEKNLDEMTDVHAVDTKVIFKAMQSDQADIIYEFLAFAIGKFKNDGVTPDVSFFDEIYEQAIDIAVAVIQQNISFFVQRLLPKLTGGIRQVAGLQQEIQPRAAAVISTNGQPQ